MFKRILINLLLVFISLIAIEGYCFYKTKLEDEAFKKQADRLESNNTRAYKTKYRLLKPFSPTVYRNSFIKENAQKSIVWFGCSFAEGAGLNDNQTPCYKISELTGESCINKAKGATSTQFMLYQLENDTTIDENVDYVIYIFIWNHIQRLYNYQINPLINMFNLRYKVTNNGLKNITPNFNPLYSSFFVKRILNKKVYNQANKESIDFQLFNAVMKKSIEISKKKYPNSKFIMVEFPELSRKELSEYEIKQLERMGITVVKAVDLIDNINIYEDKYWLPDKIHPTEETWDLILPKLKEKYMN